MDTMTRLVRSGMHKWYSEEIEKSETVYHGYSEEELIEIAKKENPKSDENSFLYKIF